MNGYIDGDTYRPGLITLAGALFGGRAGYVFMHWSYYNVYPELIPRFWQGGLNAFGAVAGGVIFALLAALVLRTGIRAALDRMSLLLMPIGTAAWLGLWGEGIAYGKTLPPGTFGAIMTPNDPEVTDTDPAAQVRALTQRGVAEAQAGERIAAVASLKEAERVASDSGLTSAAIAAHINRGWVAWVAGDVETAIPLYAEGAEMARDVGDIERLRVALANLGTALRMTGRAGEAVAVYERYLPDLADDPAAATEGLLDLGMILEETGASDAATERYWDAYELARDNDLPAETGTAAVMLGQTYAAMGESGRADACLREAADVFRTAEDEVFALHDKCPHKGGPLSQGMVSGKVVTCPMHSWKIQLESGEAVAPDKGCAHSFAVKLEAGTVWITL